LYTNYTEYKERDIHNNKKLGTYEYITIKKNWKCGPCPVLVSYTLAFALHLRKKHGKTSVRVAGYFQNNLE
jgi:hypothetical protein